MLWGFSGIGRVSDCSTAPRPTPASSSQWSANLFVTCPVEFLPRLHPDISRHTLKGESYTLFKLVEINTTAVKKNPRFKSSLLKQGLKSNIFENLNVLF